MQQRVKGAVDAITRSGRSLYTLAVLSESIDAVAWAHKFVRKHYLDDKTEVYISILKGIRYSFNVTSASSSRR